MPQGERGQVVRAGAIGDERVVVREVDFREIAQEQIDLGIVVGVRQVNGGGGGRLCGSARPSRSFR